MKTIITILCCFTLFIASQNQVYSQQATSDIQNLTVNVKGVGCQDDVKSIAANIQKLEGVLNCGTQKPGATTKFQVKFDPKKVSKNQIYEAVEDTPGCKNPKQRPYKVKNKE